MRFTFERLVTSELEESSEFVQSSTAPLVTSSIHPHDINDPHRFRNTYSDPEGLSAQFETKKCEREKGKESAPRALKAPATSSVASVRTRTRSSSLFSREKEEISSGERKEEIKKGEEVLTRIDQFHLFQFSSNLQRSTS